MKIAGAQTRPVKGDVDSNIEKHIQLINLAASAGAEGIIFPELSITGYEPELAKKLATDKNDKRLDVFQQFSDNKKITIGAGMPLRNNAGITISMIIFQPEKERLVYSKQHLHADELPFFVNGNEQIFLGQNENKAALSICYELSVPQHAANTYSNKAKIYLSSVAKSVAGVDKAMITLADIAKKYSMTVLMSNCVGHCDNFDCGGKTSAWNNRGELIGQLNDTSEGVLIADTIAQKAAIKILD